MSYSLFRHGFVIGAVAKGVVQSISHVYSFVGWFFRDVKWLHVLQGCDDGMARK